MGPSRDVEGHALRLAALMAPDPQASAREDQQRAPLKVKGESKNFCVTFLSHNTLSSGVWGRAAAPCQGIGCCSLSFVQRSAAGLILGSVNASRIIGTLRPFSGKSCIGCDAHAHRGIPLFFRWTILFEKSTLISNALRWDWNRSCWTRYSTMDSLWKNSTRQSSSSKQ